MKVVKLNELCEGRKNFYRCTNMNSLCKQFNTIFLRIKSAYIGRKIPSCFRHSPLSAENLISSFFRPRTAPFLHYQVHILHAI